MSDESIDFECEKCKVNKYCGTLITCEQAKMMYQQGRADEREEILEDIIQELDILNHQGGGIGDLLFYINQLKEQKNE